MVPAQVTLKDVYDITVGMRAELLGAVHALGSKLQALEVSQARLDARLEAHEQLAMHPAGGAEIEALQRVHYKWAGAAAALSAVLSILVTIAAKVFIP